MKEMYFDFRTLTGTVYSKTLKTFSSTLFSHIIKLVLNSNYETRATFHNLGYVKDQIRVCEVCITDVITSVIVENEGKKGTFEVKML